MMGPTVSVIVVSKDRPAGLLRCLAGLEQLTYDNFEVLVVADKAGFDAVQSSAYAALVTLIPCNQANISVARNLGLAQAAAEIVAFIDDDAVPEPTWLNHLAAPFSDPAVAAAGGFVRGRNGISFQARARRVDHLDIHSDIPIDGDGPVTFTGSPKSAIKTEGTNCAFRRDTLLSEGGFDPAFHFFLDETDVNLRLAERGAQTAIVPLAQVHHGFAASAQRYQNRLPRTLFDIGASMSVLLRKHGARAEVESRLSQLRAEQQARLIRHMTAGTCEPRDVRRLMQTLEDGIAQGAERALEPLVSLPASDRSFQRFPQFDGARCHVLSGRIWEKKRLMEQARTLVARRERVSLFVFSPSAYFHTTTFTQGGVWLQSGGVWGKSDRADRMFRATSFSKRLRRECSRVEQVRGILNN